MTPLQLEVVDAENALAQARRRLYAAGCEQAGHDWVHIGGANAGCSRDCACSIPVHECSRCGDCDYGENAWRTKTLTDCALVRE